MSIRRQQLREGDTAEVKLPFCRSPFAAKIAGFDDDGYIRIDPLPTWATWRRVRLADISKRLDPPPRKRRRTAA